MTPFKGWDLWGDFTAGGLIAATANALNGALLARQPDRFSIFTIRSCATIWRLPDRSR